MLNSICSIFIIIPIYLIFIMVTVRKKFSLLKHVLWFLFFSYITIVIAVTLFPLPYNSEFIKMNKELNYLHNNFIPFKGIYTLAQSGNLILIIRNILGNILLTMPSGGLIPFLSTKVTNIKNIIFIGIGFSLSIEISQFILLLFLGYTYKVTDIDDLNLNTIGAIIGYILYKLFCIIKE